MRLFVNSIFIYTVYMVSLTGCGAVAITQWEPQCRVRAAEGKWMKEGHGIDLGWETSPKYIKDPIPPPAKFINHDVTNFSLAQQGYAVYGVVRVCCSESVIDRNATNCDADKKALESAMQLNDGTFMMSRGRSDDILVFKSFERTSHWLTRIVEHPEWTEKVSEQNYIYYTVSQFRTWPARYSLEIGDSVKSSEATYYLWARDEQRAKQQLLAFAIVEGNTQVIKKYLAAGVKPNDQLELDWSDLDSRKASQSRPILHHYYYDTSRFDINKLNRLQFNPTLMEIAIRNQQVKSVKYLLESGYKLPGGITGEFQTIVNLTARQPEEIRNEITRLFVKTFPDRNMEKEINEEVEKCKKITGRICDI